MVLRWTSLGFLHICSLLLNSSTGQRTMKFLLVRSWFCCGFLGCLCDGDYGYRSIALWSTTRILKSNVYLYPISTLTFVKIDVKKRLNTYVYMNTIGISDYPENSSQGNYQRCFEGTNGEFRAANDVRYVPDQLGIKLTDHSMMTNSRVSQYQPASSPCHEFGIGGRRNDSQTGVPAAGVVVQTDPWLNMLTVSGWSRGGRCTIRHEIGGGLDWSSLISWVSKPGSNSDAIEWFTGTRVSLSIFQIFL